jgi:ferredoxin-NADP reductase
MKAKIKERKEISEGFLSVTFDLLGQEVNYKAGQFFSLTLLNPPHTDNRGNSRFLGIVNSPLERGIISILTMTGVSAFKKSLAELPIGTEVEISGIDGHIILPKEKTQPVVFLTSSVGIAPIMSILRWSNEEKWPYSMTLVSLHNPSPLPFLDELKTYAKDNAKFQLIETETIDEVFIKENFPNADENIYFVTGAAKIVLPIFKTLKGFAIGHVTMEIFTGY